MIMTWFNIYLLNNMVKIIFISSIPFLSVSMFLFGFLFAMITKSLVWADVETLGDRDVGGEVAM